LLRRFNYKEILLLNTKLLSTLQNKLILLFDKNLLTQSKREILINLISIFQNKLALLFDEKLLTQSEQKILSNLTFVLQLARIFTSNTKISQL